MSVVDNLLAVVQTFSASLSGSIVALGVIRVMIINRVLRDVPPDNRAEILKELPPLVGRKRRRRCRRS